MTTEWLPDLAEVGPFDAIVVGTVVYFERMSEPDLVYVVIQLDRSARPDVFVEMTADLVERTLAISSISSAIPDRS